MSLAGLVQYDSSDNSDAENDNEEIPETVNETDVTKEINTENEHKSSSNPVLAGNNERKLLLPEPIGRCARLETNDAPPTKDVLIHLNTLPKPKSIQVDENIEEDDDDNLVSKTVPFIVEKPPKKEKGPVRISIPSLSDFDDIDEKTNKKSMIQPSKKLAGVLALLPPPKSETKSSTNFVPHVLTQKPSKSAPLVPMQAKKNVQDLHNMKNPVNAKPIISRSALSSLNYDSNTDDEDEEIAKNTGEKSIDFFSLSESVNLPLTEEIVAANILPLTEKKTSTEQQEESEGSVENEEEGPSSTLTSTVMNLPRDEILLKNKAEVGPKLPVPEQEFNIDAEGNVAFDDKAIEYLCGKRGVKRKNQIINENEIIDINGEDMKPDEREWLVKALTEEPVRRPISLGSGPSSQSKKKHQITYLAHQAKAMEIELQNQWASSNLARKQTRSKYGF